MLAVAVALAAGLAPSSAAWSTRSCNIAPVVTSVRHLGHQPVGSLLRVITGLALHHGLPTAPTLIGGTGLAGGYTALNLGVGPLTLAETGDLLEAAMNIVGSFAAGLAIAAAGLALTQL
jgi:fluoride ion exporter CrcB/FEX